MVQPQLPFGLLKEKRKSDFQEVRGGN